MQLTLTPKQQRVLDHLQHEIARAAQLFGGEAKGAAVASHGLCELRAPHKLL